MTAATTAPAPPVSSADEYDAASKVRKLFLKKLKDLKPELQNWVLDCLKAELSAPAK